MMHHAIGRARRASSADKVADYACAVVVRDA